jgi:hypothetical protein
VTGEQRRGRTEVAVGGQTAKAEDDQEAGLWSTKKG